jgi:hypothetical protein
MKFLDVIQEQWFFYAILFFMSVLIGSMKFFSRFWYNLFIFIFLLGVEVALCNWFNIAPYYPVILALVVYLLFLLKEYMPGRAGATDDAKAICLPVLSGSRNRALKFYYYYANFLVYGGAGSGKTKSIGKWLLQEYIRLGFAGFIYDFKDVDYTKTAYNLIKKYDYKGEFYYINFDNLNRSYRFNPLKNISDKTLLMQLMEDMLLSMQAKDAKQDEWFVGGLGILRGVAYRLFDEFKEYCTIPHIFTLIMNASQEDLTRFLEQNTISEMMAGAFLKAKGSEKTQASYLSTLCNQIATMATDENIAWVLSGDDFDFNLIDPEHPKMFAVSNNFSKNSVYSPVIAMLLSISSRQFTMQNKVPFVYFLDEMTTVKIKNFETLPSVLREYKAAFVLLTQSGAKLENLYGKLDRSSVEANFGNMFLGRTKDVEALKYYPLFFGKEEKERRSRSAGKSGSSSNSSITISSQKEDVYQGKDFSELEPGQFIGSATRANVKEFKVKFKMFEMEEDELPIHEIVTPEQVTANYAVIINDVQAILNGDV